jgi:hypothetical protein
MFDNINAYFIENILIPFKDYLRLKEKDEIGLSLDLRTAINLATNLYHLRENLPKSIQLSRNAQSKICKDYSLLGDIVNCSKHREIDRNNPQISNSENIYEQIVITEYKDKEGPYYIKEKTIVVKLDNEQERDLHDILENVMNMWLIEFEKHKITKYIKPFQLKTNSIPKRNVAQKKFDINHMQNLRLNKKFKVQKYNYDTESIEPVDLTNSKVAFNVYEPEFIVDLEIIEKTGKSNTLEIKVTRKQKRLIENMTDSNERTMFLLKLAEVQGIITMNEKN